MDLYAIVRHRLCTREELEAVDRRSQAELDRRTDRLRKIRSYVFDEGDGVVGTICLYEAADVRDIRDHAAAADLPVDEILPVGLIDVQRPDPERVTA